MSYFNSQWVHKTGRFGCALYAWRAGPQNADIITKNSSSVLFQLSLFALKSVQLHDMHQNMKHVWLNI